MSFQQLMVLTELIELLVRDMPFLTRGQRHERLTTLLQVTSRLHGSMDSHVDAEIDRLVLRACNLALSADHPAPADRDMAPKDGDSPNETI